jgi:hypothetical protein
MHDLKFPSYGWGFPSKFQLRGIRLLEGEEGAGSVVDDTTPDIESPDLSTYQAKIDELTTVIADRDAVIADLTLQVTAAKAANYDLLMQVPGNETVTEDVDESDEVDVDVDDLFGDDKDGE